MWCASATMCPFSYLALRGPPDQRGFGRFFLASAAITLMLIFDDLFLFHEKFFPRYLHIHELVTYGTYATALLSYLDVFRKRLIHLEFPLLLYAGAFLGSSITADWITEFSEDTSTKFLIEDGLKFFGISCWFAFFLRTCLSQMRSALSLAPAPATD